MKLSYIVICLMVSCSLTPLFAQNESAISDTLSIAQAIDLAVQNNPEIKIQRKYVQMAEGNVFKANAGLLPTVNAIGAVEYSNNFSKINLRTFEPNPPSFTVEEAGVESATVSLGAQADYVLFDGKRGQYRYKLLEGQSTLVKQEQEVLMNNIALSVVQLYLEIFRMQVKMDLLQENIRISEYRLTKIEDRVAFGKASQLNVLRAQTDLNQDINLLDEIRLVKNNLTKDLNFVMGMAPETEYKVITDYPEVRLPALETLEAELLANSPELKLSQQAIRLASDQLTLSRAQTKPIISTFANAGLFYQQNDVQQLESIRNLGVTLGVSARYNLFDGGINKNKIQNAQIGMEIENLRQEQIATQLFNQAIKQRSNILLLQNQLQRENANLETYEKNFTRTQDRFYTGKATSLDLRDAQLAQLNARTTIEEIKIDIRKAVLQLDKLRGRLLK